MNRNTRPIYENTGTLRIHGKDYRLDTYYPMGKSRPAYKMFHVWERDAVRDGVSLTFASEEGFENWIEDKLTEGEQLRLC